MKAGKEHRVPLSRQALEVLGKARAIEDGSGWVFPSAKAKPLSDMTLTKLLRDNGLAAKATVHGFRTSFKTWCMETTDTPWAVGEAALAHTLGNSTEQAYARSDLFERRRELMQTWADFAAAGRQMFRHFTTTAPAACSLSKTTCTGETGDHANTFSRVGRGRATTIRARRPTTPRGEQHETRAQDRLRARFRARVRGGLEFGEE